MRSVGFICLIVGVALVGVGIFMLRRATRQPALVAASLQPRFGDTAEFPGLIRCRDVDFERMDRDFGLRPQRMTPEEIETALKTGTLITDNVWFVRPEYCRDTPQ